MMLVESDVGKSAGITSGIYRALDLWGITRSAALYWAALIITAAFVVLEARYNLDLLDALIDPASTRESIEALSNRGKLLASIGLTWVCGRVLLERVRPALLGAVLLGLLSLGLYHGLDQLYTRVIHDLPAAVKLKGFSLFSYRQDLLTGKLSDPDLPVPDEAPVYGRLVMGSFPLVLFDERFMFPVRDILERKANDKIRFVLKDAEAAWPRYDEQMQELRRGHSAFVDGSRKAYQFKDFGGLEKFRDESGGLSPDPAIKLEQFVGMLRASDHPKGKALREAEAKVVAMRPEGTAVRAGELPKFMSKTSYLRWFEDQAKAARDAALPTEHTIQQMKGVDEMNAAVFLPPMAMMTSLTSALTNALTFCVLLAALILRAIPRPAAQRLGGVLGRYGAIVMALVFASLLLLMPSHVFPSGPLYDLEDKMQKEVGVVGHAWSRLSNLQVLLLNGVR